MLQTERRPQRHIGAYVEEDRARRLVELARKEDRSVSSILRRAIDREIERNEEEATSAIPRT